jgi:hypothetical protein
MSNIESDSSDFWNLNKKSKNFKHDSESSDFWNLSKKKDSVYSSESLSTKSDDKNINNLEQEIITKEPKDKMEYKEDKEDKEDNNKIIVDSETSKAEQSDLTPINIQNKKTFLPVNKITYKNKNIGDFTIKEFYYNFTKSIIDIIKSLKQGKGLNEIFSDQDKLIHFGIILIIISILLVPLTLN